MADIINLRTARKQAKRKDREKQAEENRIRHGLTASERKAAKTVREKQERDVEAHRISPAPEK